MSTRTVWNVDAEAIATEPGTGRTLVDKIRH